MTIIIGIDPGSRKTGYGLIKAEGDRHIHLAHGCMNLSAKTLSERLRQIYDGLRDIIQTYGPEEAAIEEVFMHENPSSALKLGQARGAVLVAVGIPVIEYSARVIKQAIVGYGNASKEQIQQMVKRFLNLEGKLQADAADALAIALCHANSRTLRSRIGELTKKG